MISASSSQQVEDTIKLFDALQSNEFSCFNLNSFSENYSKIACERLINYHLDLCIVSFLKTLKSTFNVPIEDSNLIINSFASQFNLDMFEDCIKNRTLNRLISMIKWNLNEISLHNLSLHPIVISHFKSFLLEREVFNCLKSVNGFSTLKNLRETCCIKELKMSALFNCNEKEFDSVLLKQFILLTSSNVFNLLKDNNLPVLSELKELIKAHNSEAIMSNMANSIKNGLLHIGNATEEIISRLIEMISSIRELDSSGFVIDFCLKETNLYFKQNRKDIDSALLSYFLKNLSQSFSLIQSSSQGKNPFALNYYEYEQSDIPWKPDPNYIKTFINPEIRTGDPAGLVINLLSSKNSLSELYQKQVGKRLLRCHSVAEVEQIVREVEVVKIKCGDDFVNSLTIMINDIIESKFNEQKDKDISSYFVRTTIISHRYWPDEEFQDLKHPEFIDEHLESFSEAYMIQSKDRRIVWRPHLDKVKISLEFSNGTSFDFTCPAEAAILISSFDYPIDPQEEFDLKLLKVITGISDENLLKSALAFWLKRRVIIPSKRTKYNFVFAQEFNPLETECVDVHLTAFEQPVHYIDDENEDAAGDLDFSLFETKYWPIIANMFKTFGQISAERIQSTLKMYSKEYREPLELLVKFLQARVKDGILFSSGNKIILYSSGGR